MRPGILTPRGWFPVFEKFVARSKDLHFERKAFRRIARMRRAAIAARACRQRAEEIDIGKKFDVVTRAHRARLHEVFVRVAGEAGAHEDVSTS